MKTVIPTWNSMTIEQENKFMSISLNGSELEKFKKFQQFRKRQFKSSHQLFTKEELIKMAVRIGLTNQIIPDCIINAIKKSYLKMPESKFIHTIRKELKLYVCIFAPDIYYIRYK